MNSAEFLGRDAGAILGVILLVGASAAAWFLKRKMDDAAGIAVVGWLMTLMVTNVLQLIGIIFLLVGIFE